VIKLEFKDGNLNVLHNGTCVSFCRECPSYTIDDIDCGMVSVHSSICYWDDWDFVRLYVEVWCLGNDTELTLTAVTIPLDEIDSFQTIYDREIGECKDILNSLASDINRALCKLSLTDKYAKKIQEIYDYD
jgi:hypothetical protein